MGWWKALLQRSPTHGKPEPAASISQQALDTPVARAPKKVQLDSLLQCLAMSYHMKTYHINEIIPYHILELTMPFSENMRFRNCFISVYFCVSESYAQYWCSRLTDPKGVFAPCHSVISPSTYKDVSLHRQSNNDKTKLLYPH